MKMVSFLVLIHETFLCCTGSLIHLFLFTNNIPILSNHTPGTICKRKREFSFCFRTTYKSFTFLLFKIPLALFACGTSRGDSLIVIDLLTVLSILSISFLSSLIPRSTPTKLSTFHIIPKANVNKISKSLH